MSWLQDALGKAEDMLNTLDQQASTVFDDNEQAENSNSAHLRPEPNTNTTGMSTSLHFPLMSKNSSFSGSTSNQHLSPSRSIPQKSRSEIGANEIPRSSTPNLILPNLDLPTSNPLGRSHSPGGSLAGSDREMLTMKIAPSMESLASLGRQVWSKKINAHQRTNSDLQTGSQTGEGRNASNDSNVSARSNNLANASATITGPTSSTDVNSLQLENTLLRQEIANLNSEIAMLSDRCEYTKTQLNAKVSQGYEQSQALDSYQKQVGALHEDNSELVNIKKCGKQVFLQVTALKNIY